MFIFEIHLFTPINYFQIQSVGTCFMLMQALDHYGCHNTMYQVNECAALYPLSHYNMSNKHILNLSTYSCLTQCTSQTYTFWMLIIFLSCADVYFVVYSSGLHCKFIPGSKKKSCFIQIRTLYPCSCGSTG